MMAEPRDTVAWVHTDGETLLVLSLAIPIQEVLEAVHSEGSSIMRTCNIEGQRYDVTIMPLGRSDG